MFESRLIAARLSRRQQWALIIGGALILAGAIHPVASYIEWRSQAYGWFESTPAPPQSVEEQHEIALRALMRYVTAAYHYDQLFWRIVWIISAVSIAGGVVLSAAVVVPVWKNRRRDDLAASDAVSS